MLSLSHRFISLIDKWRLNTLERYPQQTAFHEKFVVSLKYSEKYLGFINIEIIVFANKLTGTKLERVIFRYISYLGTYIHSAKLTQSGLFYTIYPFHILNCTQYRFMNYSSICDSEYFQSDKPILLKFLYARGCPLGKL